MSLVGPSHVLFLLEIALTVIPHAKHVAPASLKTRTAATRMSANDSYLQPMPSLLSVANDPAGTHLLHGFRTKENMPQMLHQAAGVHTRQRGLDQPLSQLDPPLPVPAQHPLPADGKLRTARCSQLRGDGALELREARGLEEVLEQGDEVVPSRQQRQGGHPGRGLAALEGDDVLAAGEAAGRGVAGLEHVLGAQAGDLFGAAELLVPGARVAVVEEDDVGQGGVVVDDVGQVDHGLVAVPGGHAEGWGQGRVDTVVVDGPIQGWGNFGEPCCVFLCG